MRLWINAPVHCGCCGQPMHTDTCLPYKPDAMRLITHNDWYCTTRGCTYERVVISVSIHFIEGVNTGRRIE